MATYNRADLLGAAIKSVLAQTYQNWELLILDDASADGTAEAVREFLERDRRISYHPSPVNLGIARNRNRGLDLAKGAYIATLDSDDLWHDPQKLERQVAFLESHPASVVLGTFARVIDEAGRPIGHFRYAAGDAGIRARLLLRNQFTHSSVVLRSRALGDQRYDAGLPIWEDYELILRLGRKGELANLPGAMTSYRQHAGNISKAARRRGAMAHLSIIRRYCGAYPHYYLALMKAYLRLWLAGMR